MRGVIVIARDFGGAALVRRVWEVANSLVYLSSESEFTKLKAGKEGLPPIGFPAGDVFAYDAEALKQSGPMDWQRLKQWKPYKVVSAGER
jgi:hypothetical protein